jgi:hypothetical protein
MGKTGESLALGATTAVLLAGCGEGTSSDRPSVEVEAPQVAPASPTGAPAETSGFNTPHTAPVPGKQTSAEGAYFIFDDMIDPNLPKERVTASDVVMVYHGPSTSSADRVPYREEGYYFKDGDRAPIECVEPNGREVRSHPDQGEIKVEPSRTWYRLSVNGMRPFATEIYGDAQVPAGQELPRCLGATGLAVPMPKPQAQ